MKKMILTLTVLTVLSSNHMFGASAPSIDLTVADYVQKADAGSVYDMKSVNHQLKEMLAKLNNPNLEQWLSAILFELRSMHGLFSGATKAQWIAIEKLEENK